MKKIFYSILLSGMMVLSACDALDEKKISKNDKNISFFVLCRMEVYEETDFMQEVTGIGELILSIAFAFTGRGDFVCPNYIE